MTREKNINTLKIKQRVASTLKDEINLLSLENKIKWQQQPEESELMQKDLKEQLHFTPLEKAHL